MIWLLACARHEPGVPEGAPLVEAVRPTLARLDRDGDGRVGASEYEAVAFSGPAFAEADGDGDGALEAEELGALLVGQDPLRFFPELARTQPDPKKAKGRPGAEGRGPKGEGAGPGPGGPGPEGGGPGPKGGGRGPGEAPMGEGAPSGAGPAPEAGGGGGGPARALRRPKAEIGSMDADVVRARAVYDLMRFLAAEVRSGPVPDDATMKRAADDGDPHAPAAQEVFRAIAAAWAAEGRSFPAELLRP